MTVTFNPSKISILFSQEYRPTVVKANKDIAFGDVARKIAEKWKKMSDKDKEKYVKASDAKKKALAKAK